jgi:AAA domain
VTLDQMPGAEVSRRLSEEAAALRNSTTGQVATDHHADDSPPDGELAPDLLSGLRNGEWLDQQRFPPLTYAIPGVIPEGSTLLVGPPKIGKSWFVLACALATATGGRALGVIPVEARPVLYLALEDGDRRLQDRCRTLLAGDPIPRGFEYLTDIQPGQVLDTIVAWADRVPPDRAPLIILDTLGKVMPPARQGESSYQRDYRIGSALKTIAGAHPGTSVLVNHHDRKADAEDFVDSVSGTHGLAGAADTIVILTRPRLEQDGLLKVTGRDIPEGEYAVAFQHNSAWTLEGETLADAAATAYQRRVIAGLGDRLAEVIVYVTDHSAGVRAGQVAEALNMNEKQAGVYLGRAVKSGRLARPERGLYTPVGSVGLLDSSGKPTQQSNTSNSPTGGHLTVVPDDGEGDPPS